MERPRKITVAVTNRTMVRAIFWLAVAVLGYKFIGMVSHVLTLIAAAVFVALALNPVVSAISRRLKVHSRIRATASAYLLVVAVLTLFFVLVIPPLVQQTRDFIRDVPQKVQNFQDQDNSLSRAVKRYDLDEKLNQAAKDFASNYGGFGSKLLDTGRRVVEALVSVLVVLVLAFMMLVEGPAWLETYFKVLPERKREHHRRLAHKIYRAVTAFVNGQVILAAVAGLFAFIALEIAGQVLNIPTNAAALAGIVAVFGIIPLFGNPIAASVVVLVSLLNSGALAVVMAIYFIVYFFIENHTFQPYIQSKLSELTPLTVFIAALIGIGFGGILGAIVAIPAASTVKIIIEDYVRRRRQVVGS
ncbi:hypothetical protein A3F65_03775 [Candidatus Saccharibacteria bacterium RIFCSPHIGHO2_12_FULL_47_16b]|nr:MAG: hypothetical protein A3F65_03775 [Candidatus Saccharibacteria bacterium RIFCSPHIGHO2_12_FULL_47_16b]